MNAPKLISNMTFGDYCDLDAINISKLLLLVPEEHTPQMARWLMLHPKEDRRSLTKGHAVHSAVLEPEQFKSLYLLEPCFGDYRSSANRTRRDAWREENADKIWLEQEEMDTVLAMRESLSANASARPFFEGPGQNELTVVWTDEKTGLDCKARVDRITMAHGYQTVIDIKSGRDLSDHGVAKAIADYHYYVRMPWYVDALNMVHPSDWRPVFVWVSNMEKPKESPARPPTEVRVTECEEDPFTEGRALARRLLDLYADCKARDHWPSFAEGIDVINPPRWIYRLTTPKGIM